MSKDVLLIFLVGHLSFAVGSLGFLLALGKPVCPPCPLAGNRPLSPGTAWGGGGCSHWELPWVCSQSQEAAQLFLHNEMQISH